MIKITFPSSGLILQEVEATLTDEINKMMTDLHAGLVRVSPVDTGRMRNGWDLTLGADPAIENMVEYTGYVMEHGTSTISPKLLITAEIARVTR